MLYSSTRRPVTKRSSYRPSQVNSSFSGSSTAGAEHGISRPRSGNLSVFSFVLWPDHWSTKLRLFIRSAPRVTPDDHRTKAFVANPTTTTTDPSGSVTTDSFKIRPRSHRHPSVAVAPSDARKKTHPTNSGT
uniref:Uncharacterized protein n=1 Tax=Peronospora matthiolae TaxID=2874970 RepID=A0AAV1UYN3_9STRA